MSIIKSIQARNGYLLCKKVEYGPKVQYDKEDTSNIWYEVVIGYNPSEPSCENLPIQPGDLVRFPPRHVAEEVINGETFYSFHQSQVSFIIERRKHVKKNISE